jgi:hypothetical protein
MKINGSININRKIGVASFCSNKKGLWYYKHESLSEHVGNKS